MLVPRRGRGTIRRKLLKDFNFHTLLRLPPGIFYSQGVKANVLFFENTPAGESIATEALCVTDLRINQRFTLRERPLERSDIDEFVAAYGKEHRQSERVESQRLHRFSYYELVKHDKLNLEILRLKDVSATEPDSLPSPDEIAAEIAAEIVTSLELALKTFRSVAARLAHGI